MPLVMWTLVVAFVATIIFSWGMGGFQGSSGGLDGVVGKVGNSEILYDRYNRIVQDRLAQQRQEKPDMEITDQQIKQVRQQVWDDLVRVELMKLYQKKWGIVTSDDEVAYSVRNNPPEYVRTNANFQTDGKFDPALYRQFLADPNQTQTLIAIEQDYRESMGNQKVIDKVISPVFVAPQEAWDEYVATNAKFKGIVASFPSTAFTVDSMSISAGEIEKYYSDHIEDFKVQERRKLSYVTIPLVMTAQDTERVSETIADLQSMLRQGDSFEQVAEEYSEDVGSAKQQGSLGWFGRGRMVAEFDSTVFVAEIGKVVGPVMTRFGAHLIRVEERDMNGTADSVKASHILVKYGIGPDTEARVAQKAKDFADAATADGFEAAAAQFSLKIENTALFPYAESGSVPTIGSSKPIMDFAFKATAGKVSYSQKTKIKGQDGYSVFTVAEIAPAGTTPQSEAESTIRTLLVRKKQQEMALQAAQQFRSRIGSADQLVPAAQAGNVKIDSTGLHGQREFIRGIGQDEEIGKSLLTLSPGQVSEALGNSRGGYVVTILEKVPADTTQFVAQKDQLLQNLERTKQNRVFTDWLKLAKEELVVVDNRYLYYTDF
ncbi:MAG: SurA N-terminal domain-containing protein [bacterium]|nr:SurA N-terminal domain-containing protein [bacterium]